MQHHQMRRALAAAAGLVATFSAIPFIYAANAAPQRQWSAASRSLRIEDRTGDPRLRVAAIRAVDGWNAAGAGIHLTYTSTPSFDGSCGYHGTTVSVCRDHLPSGELAVTNYRSTSDGKITDAFVVVNADRSLDDSVEQSLLCHEFGHVLGLDHSPDATTSCLGSDPNSFPLTPDDRDVMILRDRYRP